MEKLVSGVADRVQDPYRIDSIGPWHVKSCVNSGLRCESPSNITASRFSVDEGTCAHELIGQHSPGIRDEWIPLTLIKLQGVVRPRLCGGVV